MEVEHHDGHYTRPAMLTSCTESNIPYLFYVERPPQTTRALRVGYRLRCPEHDCRIIWQSWDMAERGLLIQFTAAKGSEFSQEPVYPLDIGRPLGS